MSTSSPSAQSSPPTRTAIRRRSAPNASTAPGARPRTSSPRKLIRPISATTSTGAALTTVVPSAFELEALICSSSLLIAKNPPSTATRPSPSTVTGAA